MLLTYFGFESVDHWHRYIQVVKTSLQAWRVLHWCTTLETTAEGRLHAHTMLQFRQAVDQTTAAFTYDGLRPNVRPTDLCGEGLCRKKLQRSIDQEM